MCIRLSTALFVGWTSFLVWAIISIWEFGEQLIKKNFENNSIHCGSSSLVSCLIYMILLYNYDFICSCILNCQWFFGPNGALFLHKQWVTVLKKKKKNNKGLQWGSIWTYDLRVYKEKELNATYCCFHFYFEVQSKVMLHTMSFMFVLCIFNDDGWPIFLWPWSVLIHKLSTPLHDFFLTLQVVSGLHLLRCMWKIVCEGKLLPCLFEGIDYFYYFIKFMGFLMFFYIIQLESIVYD